MFYWNIIYDEVSVKNATFLLDDVNFKRKNSNNNKDKNNLKPVTVL